MTQTKRHFTQRTKRSFTPEEVQKAKADKSIREKIIADMEEKFQTGRPRPITVEGSEVGIKMCHRVATEDAIRLFCDGIGDFNPLYRSRDYARNSIYDGIIAPPRFLTAIVPIAYRREGLRGRLDFSEMGFYAGTRIEWFKVIRAGDEFTVFEVPLKIIDATREDTALQFIDSMNIIYKNQRDEVVAIATISHYTLVIPAGKEVQEVSRQGREIKLRHFSEEEVEEWYRLTEQEEIRGANPRFWEDVNIGDELPPTHHVWNTQEDIAFSRATGHGGNWLESMRGTMRKTSSENWRDLLAPESGLPDFGGQHTTDAAAQISGIPRSIAAGDNLCCWLVKLVTNWMGDAGFLKKMGDQIRSSLWNGSLALCKGQVVKKYIEGDEHLVDLHLTLEDHNGRFMIPNGSATVILPSRRMENWRP